MNLSPDLINRLVALKSLLDLGDMELATVASSRLEANRGEPEIEELLTTLTDYRYAKAAALIDKLLLDGTRIAAWTDPEIVLLEAELEQLTAELADLETEQAELEHLVSRFQAAHNEILGERIAKLLKLRMLILERQLKTNPEKQTAYSQASHDYNEFQRDQEIQREADARTKWELSEHDQLELKRLFRAGAKLCHPDLVPAGHHHAATAAFRELRTAYDEGKIQRLRELVARIQSGLFDAKDDPGDSNVRKKERLIARISGIRDAIEQIKESIRQIKCSSTYHTMAENTDWAGWLGNQAKILDREIENLNMKMTELRNV